MCVVYFANYSTKYIGHDLFYTKNIHEKLLDSDWLREFFEIQCQKRKKVACAKTKDILIVKSFDF
jgi:hypothetical protein